MKHLKHLFTAIMLFCSLSANAYDFTANGIYYKFIQGTSNAVEVTYTGAGPYYQSSYSGSIVIPENVTYGNNTYEVTRIGNNAFYKSSITSVTIPSSVTSIGSNAFYNSSITSVTIPSSVTSIGSSAFYNCSSLNSVHITDLSAWCKIDMEGWSSNPLYHADCLYLNGNLIENLVIPDDITEIKTYAFYSYSRLASVEFHNGVTSIGSYAFGRCTELADIVFPSDITNIGDYAFGDTQWYYNQPDGEIYIGDLLFRYKGSMPANTAYTIKEGTKYIADFAFSNCENLTRVTIPSSVTKIGDGIFAWCFKLEDIFCYATTVPEVKNLFVEINLHSIALHVPAESLEMYKASDDWNIFGSLTYIGEEIYVDGIKYSISPSTREAAVIAHDNQYSGDIVIPERITYNNTTYNVTDIIRNAFRNCTDLKSVVIPNSVTNIGGSAFYECDGLTKVVIGDGVTAIGVGAFRWCNNLVDITGGSNVAAIGDYAFNNTAWYNNLPDGPIYIGKVLYNYKGDMPQNLIIEIKEGTLRVESGAFQQKSGLTSITIPNSVTSIGDYAFAGCSGLRTVINFSNLTFTKGSQDHGYIAYYADKVINTSDGLIENDFVFGKLDGANALFAYLGNGTDITLPDNYKGESYAIAAEAFRNNTNLTNINIPDCVTSIGNYAFMDCSQLESITIGNSVKSIGDYAFEECTGLTSITIPNNVTYIGSYAFCACTGLTSITIPDNVTSIGDYTFHNCTALTSITIPNSITSIGDGAFYYCPNLTDINIPDNVTSIGERAFYSCSSLTSIEIPSSVTNIGDYAFYYCSNQLESIVVENGNTVYDSRENCNAIIETASNALILGCRSTVIPYSITSIGNNAFSGCSGLTDIYIHSNVKKLGNSAFSSCSSLKHLYIEESNDTLTLGYNRYGYDSLGAALFAGCPLETVYLGRNLKDGGMPHGYSPFYNKTTLKNVVISNCVTGIDDYTFAGCSGLTDIAIPNSVTYIGERAFWGCKNLASIVVGSNVKQIKTLAFSDCTALKTIYNGSEINITKKTTDNGYVGYYANEIIKVNNAVIENGFLLGIIDNQNYLIKYFGHDYAITLPLHYNNESYIIREKAFENNSFITEIAIPQNVTGIGNRSFYGCTALESLTIPNAVTSIGDNAFEGCCGLTEISIGNGVTSVGASAFSGCTQLENLYIGNSIESIGNYAFGGCNNIMEIIASSQKAIMANENVFSTDTYNNACLYVPTKRKVAYGKTVPWKNFYIEEMNFDVSHTVTFMVGGNVYETAQVKFSETIPLPAEPVKEHYTFDGWENLPATMPARDVTVNALFTAKSYTVTFMIDGTVYRTISVKYGETIPLPAGPSKEDYIFSWNGVPNAMPGEDITITGTFASKKFNAVFMVDGKRYHSVALKEGETIPLPEEPAIEGYTFDGWDFIPDVMPGKDVTITALLTAKSYTVTFMDGEKVHETRTVKYGENITVPEMPEKENYTFVWNDVPSKMPAYNIVIYGSYTVNSYTVTFMVDGRVYKSVTVEYGKEITLPEEPVKEGHTFNGWNNLPATMPAEDITVTASFTAAGYTVTFVIDGEVYATVPVKYGEEIPLPQEPVKVGHTFKGWSRTPDTMPANDVTVTGSFTVNSYTVTFLVDGKVHKSVAVKYGEEIPLPKEPKKDGYTFSGWENLPATMPAEEITVTALFTANSYTVTFVIDGEVYATAQVNYGEAITLPQEPVKEGHTFNGWNNLPATMPKKDITATGSFTVNSYTVTFTIDGEVYATVQVNYGEEIALPQEPVKDGYTFNGWNDIPETMPAEDITVNGTFTEHTGIDAAAEEVEVIVYNLKGERITDTGNLAKGVYIINGKKTVVR